MKRRPARENGAAKEAALASLMEKDNAIAAQKGLTLLNVEFNDGGTVKAVDIWAGTM